MTAAGYRPSREQMRLIVDAAGGLLATVERWKRCRELPAYPQERGNLAALAALFRIERALNPYRIPWGDGRRTELGARVWPDEVIEGLVWLRALADLAINRRGLEAMSCEADHGSWLVKAEEIPHTISFNDDELSSLHEIIRLLPGLANLPEPQAPTKATNGRPTGENAQRGPARLSEFLSLAPGMAVLTTLQEHAATAQDEAGGPKVPTDPRDKFCYEQELKLIPRKSIVAGVKATPEWDQLGTGNGVKQAAESYAKRHGLPEIPSRRNSASRSEVK